MNCSHPCRGPRLAAGFTLVEALLAISIAAIGASVLLLGITSSVQTSNEALQKTIAHGMAQQLMDEVVGGRYVELAYDSDGTTLLEPEDLPLGPDAAEPTREDYDDIDDYDGIRSRPPTDPWGIELGKDDGEGGQRHPDFQAPAGFFDNWRQRIDVYYVAPSDLTAPAGRVTEYRAVRVRIVYVDPERGDRVLAELSRVVAYVPPIPPI